MEFPLVGTEVLCACAEQSKGKYSHYSANRSRMTETQHKQNCVIHVSAHWPLFNAH